MKTFPMFLQMAGRHVVIVGGGEQAAQKARLMQKTEAEIRLIADALDPELEGLVASGGAVWDQCAVTAARFENAALVFVATGCPGLDAAIHGLAKAAGTVVNVVDRPDLCDAVTPSLVDRDPVVVAIGTEGTAPVLARQIKTKVEEMLAPNLGNLARLAGTLRGAVAARVPQAKRRAFWAWVFNGPVRATHARGAERDAAAALKAALAAGGAPEGVDGCITLVGAGPGARDLLTLRAVQRLQEADVIFYDRLVDPDALELARRDAERVYVGKSVGASAWPQDRINALIVAEAQKGRRVVRLKSGDPGIFGRAEEELSAAAALGIPTEIVPGVTAASAASASLGRGLTERGLTDCVTFVTGTCREGAADPDLVALARPGTALALYMARRQSGKVQSALRQAGWPEDTVIDLVARASWADEAHVETTLAGLPGAAEALDADAAVVILARLPKDATLEVSHRAPRAVA